MLPQHVREEGGYHKKGKSEAEAQSLLDNSLALQDAGCCSLVLEIVDAQGYPTHHQQTGHPNDRHR